MVAFLGACKHREESAGGKPDLDALQHMDDFLTTSEEDISVDEIQQQVTSRLFASRKRCLYGP